MHCQAVKDQHISRIDLAANPITPRHSLRRNLWNVEIHIVMSLKAEAMRTFQYLQGTCFERAVVKRNPNGKAFRISAHKSVILMGMNDETLAVRKNQPSNRFRVNQEIIAHKHFHDPL